ncbi:primase-helicase zinc-binding domain-containing protein [Piscinibacter sakaiensis]|uniref:primase-helicase zinc-binding domain-containing protein n=1 Tax=Piscinibacter sakaiensis TaxID=1547922 RepID=UPI003AAE6151
MQRADYEARVDEVKRRAHGHWTQILGSLGVDERILGKRNGPCPLCGGTDRFQYTVVGDNDLGRLTTTILAG